MDDVIPPDPSERMVVAFDFDGTMTVRDSFTAFLKWRAGRMDYAFGLLKMLPELIAYTWKRDRGLLKAAAVRIFLKGVPRPALEAAAREFAEEWARRMLRPDALACWKWWRDRGARLFIVTASPDLLVAPFARGLGAEMVIGTQIAFDEGDKVIGGFSRPNCRGQEKVRRLHEVLGEGVQLTAAYGDTSGDREMLQMAVEKGYRIFKGRPG
ncbi:MAG: phosphoserine phosphatase [Caulobacteraceae bacterium]|nr:phosphoserine phosphatase [Caulobacteraceae bacterium]